MDRPGATVSVSQPAANEATGVAGRTIAGADTPGAKMRVAPPTVPRDVQSDYYRSFYGMSPAGYTPQHPFSAPSYPSLGSNYGLPFGNYSPLTYSAPPYRMNATPASFVRLAEQQARPAFETLESTLQAVSSVLMVLESTYFTITNSFRAVLSIVDQFGRLKSQLKRIMQTFVLLRLLKRTILFVRAKLFGIEDASGGSFGGSSKREGESFEELSIRTDSQLSWPVLVFLLVAVGGPILMWKLISSMLNLSTDCDSWKTGRSEHYLAIAEFDYTAEHNDELAVVTGDELRIAPKHLQPDVRGWLLAAQIKDEGVSSGLLPANYVRIVGRVHSSTAKTPRTTVETDVPQAVVVGTCEAKGNTSS